MCVCSGLVVLGDPKAVTCLDVSLSGIQVAITSASHYLPVMTTPTQKPKTPPVTAKHGKKSKRLSVSPLPCLRVCLGPSTGHVVLPMYGGNASQEVPQESKLHGILCDVTVDALSVLSLMDAFQGLESRGPSLADQFLTIPKVDCSYDVVKYGQVGGVSQSKSDLKCEFTGCSLKLSSQHISRVVFVVGSWKATELAAFLSGVPPVPCTLKYHPPILLMKKFCKFSHVVLSLDNFAVSILKNSKFTSYRATVDSAHIKVVREGGVGGCVAVLYGPMDTVKYTGETAFHPNRQSLPVMEDEDGFGRKKVLDVLLSSPQEKYKGNIVIFYFEDVELCL